MGRRTEQAQKIYMVKHILKIVMPFVVIALLLTASFAQQPRGTLRGVVKDELGGLVAGATVTLTGQNGEQKTATADANGEYVFDGLPIGAYNLSASASGFAVTEQMPISITANLAAPVE